MNDPLESLIVDAREVDRERLRTCLDGLVAVDGETGDLVLMPNLDLLPSVADKILAYLLGMKAAKLLGRREKEALRPAAIADELGIAPGTVRRTVRELADQRLVAQTSGKEYFVQSHQLTRISRRLRQEGM